MYFGSLEHVVQLFNDQDLCLKGKIHCQDIHCRIYIVQDNATISQDVVVVNTSVGVSLGHSQC